MVKHSLDTLCFKLFAVIAVAFALASCGSYKEFAYLQDAIPGTEYTVSQFPHPTVMKGDQLQIAVFSSQPSLSAPFNAAYQSQDGKSSDVANSNVYLVDSNGNIDFPILGDIYVEGLSLEELKTKIEKLIVGTDYVKDPFVKVEYINFSVSILGEVFNPGLYSFTTGEITVLDLISRSKDLLDAADRENVKVIRTTGDKRMVYSLNLKSKDIFDSPAYYLQQNDIVYVQPLNTKVNTTIANRRSNILLPVTFVTSLLSSAIFVISIIKSL